MNREFLLDAVIGVGLGVFMAMALAWTAQRPDAGGRRRGLVVATLVYALIAANVVLRDGVTLWSWLAVAALVMVPLLVARAGARMGARMGTRVTTERVPVRTDSDPDPALADLSLLRIETDPGHAASAATRAVAETHAEPILVRAARDLVGIGLLVVVLTAIAQTLSLLGRLDPRVATIIVALVAAFVAIVTGVVGSSRLGVWGSWLLVIPLLIMVAVAVLVGNVGDLSAPAVLVGNPSPGQWAALLVAFIALGWADPALRAIGGPFSGSQLGRTIIGVLAILLIGGIATLVFLGGSTVAPSLAFFTLPANLDVIPGPIILLFLAFTVLAVAMASALMVGTGRAGAAVTDLSTDTGRADPLRVAIVAVAAVVLTLLGVGLEPAAVAAALVAAALLGAGLVQHGSPNGLIAGLVAAVVAGVILAIAGGLRFDWPAALAVIAVGVVAIAVSSMRSAPDREPATV